MQDEGEESLGDVLDVPCTHTHTHTACIVITWESCVFTTPAHYELLI